MPQKHLPSPGGQFYPMNLASGHYVEILDSWVHETSTLVFCPPCELESKIPHGSQRKCHRCGSTEGLKQRQTLVHYATVAAMWASQADHDAGKPPLQIEDFETQLDGPHPNPGSCWQWIFDRWSQKDLSRPDTRTLKRPEVEPPDVHGNFSHPSMQPFRRAQA